MKVKIKIIHKNQRKNLVFLYITVGLVAFWIAVAVFLFFYKEPGSLYVYPETVKQGDTVFIRVKSYLGNVTGEFENEKLIFSKTQNENEWVSFLGVDAVHNPGDYKIVVGISGIKTLQKNIKVSLADFSKGVSAPAPSAAKTGITIETAINNIKNKDNPVLQKVLDKSTEKPYFDSAFAFPLKKVEERGMSFGKFIEFAKIKIQHLGVDLRAPKDTEIYSVNNGKVVLTASLANYGKTIIIDHGLDIFSLYLHLDKFSVEEGAMVKKGQLIGLSGETGYATAPHLHFSMRVDGARVNPIQFVTVTKKIDESFMLADITSAFLNVLNLAK
jgi:murein DD-endopeptidase MepM/ murein hydrolase activator NlpD